MFVWIDMLPRSVWRVVYHPSQIDIIRQWLNSVIVRSMVAGDGQIILHSEIQFWLPHLFRSDGVYLLSHYNFFWGGKRNLDQMFNLIFFCLRFQQHKTLGGSWMEFPDISFFSYFGRTWGPNLD